MITHLLDTNACIHLLRNPRTSPVAQRIAVAEPGSVALCSVVKAELFYGAERSNNPEQGYDRLEHFFESFDSLLFDDRAALEYGVLRRQLESQGQPIGPNDLLIAAISLANDLTLVTHNVGEFSRVSGLRIEDWQTP